jgi:hypothetical protein
MSMAFVCAVSMAPAQMARQSNDVLGPHLNYGRGCSACHTPHRGVNGDGAPTQANPGSAVGAVWGQDVTGLYGKTIATGGGKFVEVLPTRMSAETPDVAGMLTCLSCHDGNYSSNTMMNNSVYEKSPHTYGTSGAIPTLLGRSDGIPGNYFNQHPMGLTAQVGCGGNMGWDCSISGGEIRMTGANARQFVSNYGFFVKPASYNNTAVVVCTTCHDPHSMNVVLVESGSESGLPPGTYATTYFLRGPYNPADVGPYSNQTAQFCRQCHADKSNEMNGSTAKTVF